VAISAQERPEEWLTHLRRGAPPRRPDRQPPSRAQGPDAAAGEASLELGDIDAVRIEVEICDADGRASLRLDERSWHLPMVRSGLAMLAGRLEEADRLAEQGLRQGLLTQHPGVEVYHGALVGAIRYLQGRMPELEDALRRNVER